jgi:hypothetical protein
MRISAGEDARAPTLAFVHSSFPQTMTGANRTGQALFPWKEERRLL